jgi:dTDP-4-amino-4,6-dideoxy-D-galactose acyltransferase
MKREYLDWDSRFFGLRVERVVVEEARDASALEDGLRQSSADVLYVFVPSACAEACRKGLEDASGLFCDRKVTYRKEVGPVVGDGDGAIREEDAESEALMQLAYESGHLSRFNRDSRFRPYFKALYAEWVRKALAETDSRVFAFSEERLIRGMVTVSASGGLGWIGLLAVDAACQGRGIGLRLLSHCERFYARHACTVCRVVTQKDNVAACRLYLKAGYAVESEQDVWHVWRRPR